MAFPNVSDIVATTIENRSKEIADNVLGNNVLLKRLQQKGNVRSFSGGSQIFEELSFAANGNASWYSGYDLLPVAAQDVISSAAFPIAQAAVPVVISGLELLQNSGKEQMIDLIEARMKVAESSMANLLASALYSDGTGFGGKQLIGLNAAVPTAPTSGTYGGINRASWPFWQSQVQNPGAGQITATTINTYMNKLWASLVRGKDRPDLIVFDNNLWQLYTNFLQNLQRFNNAEKGELGFPSLDFMGADVVLDGGIGGFCPANTGFFLNTDYLFYRPHKDRDMVPLNPSRRYAINQDAEVQILAFAGQVTCSGAQFQGRIIGG